MSIPLNVRELIRKLLTSWFVSGSSVSALLLGWMIWNKITGKLRVSNKNKTVLVTGCDTGFGNMLAKQLSGKGVRVIALCLTPTGAEKLKEETSGLVTALVCDVTDEKAVYAIKDYVYQNFPEGLWGLVNNAGINAGLLTELTPMSTFRRVMEVNYFSYVLITQCFIPLLRKTKGRIVNVASVAGRLSTPPLVAYGGSKFAVEGFSDALRLEMAQFGIRVSILEPGFMRTPIVEYARSGMQADFNRAPAEARAFYGESWGEKMTNHAKLVERVMGDPAEVVNVMEEALFTYWPRTRYMIGHDTWLYQPLSLLPGGVRDTLFGLTPRLPIPEGLNK